MKTNHPCKLRNWLWHATVDLVGIGLSAWCLQCYKGQTHKHSEGTTQENQTYRISLSICRVFVTILSAIQVYRLYVSGNYEQPCTSNMWLIFITDCDITFKAHTHARTHTHTQPEECTFHAVDTQGVLYCGLCTL